MIQPSLALPPPAVIGVLGSRSGVGVVGRRVAEQLHPRSQKLAPALYLNAYKLELEVVVVVMISTRAWLTGLCSASL